MGERGENKDMVGWVRTHRYTRMHGVHIHDDVSVRIFVK